MSARDFMARVLPWPSSPNQVGHISLHWHLPGQNFSGKVVPDVDFLLSEAHNLISRRQNIYFCLSRQSQLGVRNAQNALELKSIWLDVDVGNGPKKYGTFVAALEAITDFIRYFKLPPPSALVASGGGVHVYWISNTILPVNDWKPYAEGLKQAALQFKLKCDAGITTDPARVLRVPGTLNFKTDPPRDVKLLKLGTDYDFSTNLQMLLGLSTASIPQHFDPTVFPKKAKQAGKDSLSDGIAPDPLPPLDFNRIKPHCEFLRTAFETGGKDYTQPEWNLTTLIATFLEDGDKLAHAFGNQHPGYSEGSTDALLARKIREKEQKKLGWPSCEAIRGAGSRFCDTCPQLCKGKSPLNLGLPERKAQAFAVAPPPPPELDLPDGYTVDDRGRVCKVTWVKPPKAKKGEQQEPGYDELRPLLHTRIRQPVVQVTPFHALNFVAELDKGHTTNCCILMEKMTVMSIAGALLQYGVALIPENQLFLGSFFMAWITKLRDMRESLRATSFGWWNENSGFIFGGRIWKRDGSSSPSGFMDLRLRDFYTPKGDAKAWVEASKLITNQNRPDLNAIIAASFAAPLMKFVGECGVLISAYGDSGSTKSTAVKIALAVWGHPKNTKESTTSTAKSVINNMGQIRHLPCIWDDIQFEHQRAHVAAVGFQASEGIEGRRINTSIQQQNRGGWQTIVVACSNASIVDHIVKKSPDTSATIMRTFEFPVPKDLSNPGLMKNSVDASMIVQELESNYGRVGEEYAKLLATDMDGIKKIVRDASAEFNTKLNVTNDERFWLATCAVLFVGAAMANRFGAQIDMATFKAFLEKTFLDNRTRRQREGLDAGSIGHTQSFLNEYMNYIRGHGNVVWTDVAFKKPGTIVNFLAGPSAQAPREVHAHFIVNDRILRISKNHIVKDYIPNNKKGMGSTLFVKGMKDHYGAVEKKATLASGTHFNLTQETVFEIPIPPGSEFEDMMNSFGS